MPTDQAETVSAAATAWIGVGEAGMHNAIPWVRGPVGLEAAHRVTRAGCHMVLVMVPTVTAGTRLMDLLPLLEADHRVHVVFTVPRPDETWQGVDEFVQHGGGLVVPWHQARHHRWDLVLSASHRHIEQVHGKLLVLPHGAGAIMSRRRSRKAGTAIRDTTGLDRELLTFRGRLVPAAVALTNDHELHALRKLCPEAAHTAVVAGDLCLDRMVVSLPLRRQYRQALGVSDAGKLITISSTWSPDSTFGRHLDLYERLMDEASTKAISVAAILHPNIWAVHGTWQVLAWLAAAIRKGLMIISPDRGWHGAMIASDHVIGDHGSTTSYAAAIGRPVHLATFPDHNVRRGSVAGELAHIAPRLHHARPLLPQLHEIANHAQCRRLAAVITSRPGQAAQMFRTTMYRLLQLPEPSWPAHASPVPLPQPITR